MSFYNTELMEFLSAGCSPYHTVAHAASYLEKAGFRALPLSVAFEVERG